jgi:hypothetical protein
MNITLVANHIVIGDYNNSGAGIDISDQVGFSTANLDEGFNNFGDSYTDGVNPYPLIEEAALIIYARWRPYNAADVDATVSGDIVRTALVAPAATYAGIAWDLSLDLQNGDGWYTLECTLLDAAAAAPGAIPYYNTGDSTIRDAADLTITADALAGLSVATVTIEQFLTPQLDAYVNQLAAEAADAAIDSGNCSGPCSEAYKKALKEATYAKAIVDGAEKWFDAGNYSRAQELITNLFDNLS